MPRIVGYSDRVNHAFAFAAKHHDRQVRKGTALPYLTHPANVAVILTRYGCSEVAVLGGILHDVVEDSVRDGYTREDLMERIGSKFGNDVLSAVLSVTERKVDDDGVDLSWEERKDDYLDRLGEASESAHWICAADKLHNACTILSDLKRTAFPETVWGRFARGPDVTAGWYRRVFNRLQAVGFDAAIMDELHDVVVALEAEATKATAGARS
jgi:(p)ppGpp synthase/HD superfamily hydrolase